MFDAQENRIKRARGIVPAPLAAVLEAAVDAAQSERDRWILWVPVGFAAGIAAYFALPEEPTAWAGLGCLGAGAIVYGLRGSLPMGAFLGIVMVLLGAGFATAQLRTAMVAAPVLMDEHGPVDVMGRIVGLEDQPRGPRIVLEEVTVERLRPEETPRRIRLRLHRGDTAAIGTRVEILAQLTPPPRPALPGGFDFRRYLWFEGIGATGFALSKTALLPEQGKAGPWLQLQLTVASLRRGIVERVRTVLPGDSGTVAAALIAGDRSAIPEAVLVEIRHSGLAHLLAISGLHMGLVAATLFFGLRAGLALFERVTLRFAVKKWAAMAALAGSFVYLLIAGATVPTQRAYLMTGLVLLAVLLDRTAISQRLVAIAAIVVLVLGPEGLLGASFQMSFAAVIALVALYERVGGRIGAWLREGGSARRVAVYFATLTLTTLTAGMVTGFFAAFHFGEIARYGLVANLLSVPATALWIMPMAVAAVILMPFGLEALALVPMGWGVDFVLWVAKTVAGWPGGVGLVPAMPLAALLCVTLGGLWLCLWRRRWRLLGLGGIAAGLALAPFGPRPDILVADSGKLFAVRLLDGRLALSTMRAERYVGEVWLRAAGQEEAMPWPPSGEVRDGLACDPLGCIWQSDAGPVAFVQDPRAPVEDCHESAVLVSAVPVFQSCPRPRIVIDRFDLWRHGAHSVELGTGIVRTAAGEAGIRPWAPRRPTSARTAAR